MFEMYIKGTQVNYYFVCKTKLWLFSHNITMENESDLVKLGKLLHQEVFERENKEILIGSIAIDIIRKRDIIEIREIKKSDSFEDADFYQTLYYLYYLRNFGINAKGILTYPKQRKIRRIELDGSLEKQLDEILKDIDSIIKGDMPPPKYSKACRKCAYFEFCFA